MRIGGEISICNLKEGPHQNPTMLAPLCQASSLQKGDTKGLGCFVPAALLTDTCSPTAPGRWDKVTCTQQGTGQQAQPALQEVHTHSRVQVADSVSQGHCTAPQSLTEPSVKDGPGGRGGGRRSERRIAHPFGLWLAPHCRDQLNTLLHPAAKGHVAHPQEHHGLLQWDF